MAMLSGDEWMTPPPDPDPPRIPLGRRATVCIGGCMNGEFVYAGIATRFFRKVNNNPLEGPQVHSYRLVKGALFDTFVLEEPK